MARRENAEIIRIIKMKWRKIANFSVERLAFFKSNLKSLNPTISHSEVLSARSCVGNFNELWASIHKRLWIEPAITEPAIVRRETRNNTWRKKPGTTGRESFFTVRRSKIEREGGKNVLPGWEVIKSPRREERAVPPRGGDDFSLPPPCSERRLPFASREREN